MVVRSAVSLAVRQAGEVVLHPRRAVGQVVSEVGGAVSGVAGSLVGVGDAVVGRLIRSLDSPAPDASHSADVDPEDLLDRPGPLPEDLVKGAMTPAPRPEPPRARRTARKVGEEVRTPSGIPAADPGHNPSTGETDLVQPGTEPIMDPATTKAVAAEARMMRRAASREK